MESAHELQCGPLRINLRPEQVWRGTEALHLRPKSFAVLRYLIERAGRLVSKDTLLQACWPETVGSEAALTICIGELRGTGGCGPGVAVHRDGAPPRVPVYRPHHSTGTTSVPALVSPAPRLPRSSAAAGGPRGRARAASAVPCGPAQHGERQVVFVTGESGIGKTTMVDAFCAHTGTKAPLWVARGQCLVTRRWRGLPAGAGGAGTAVSRARGRAAGDACCTAGADLADADAGAPRYRGAGGATAAGAGCHTGAHAAGAGGGPGGSDGEQPLVLVLEDLHWSDAATLDLLAWLARRREPARLLLIGTYRPASRDRRSAILYERSP